MELIRSPPTEPYRKTLNDLDSSTLEASTLDGDPMAEGPLVSVVWTILAHPGARRVGERSPVPELAETRAGAAPLSRLAPSEISEQAMLSALHENDWNVLHSARALRVSRSSLYALMERSEKVRKGRDLFRAEIAAAMDEEGGNLAAPARRLEVSKQALQLRMQELGMREARPPSSQAGGDGW